ncbi:hypothetical protein CHU98_g2736 [Xylaria longipes]|nr:hypothetical protein CHU98_g2736 [Xylaria longipes]
MRILYHHKLRYREFTPRYYATDVGCWLDGIGRKDDTTDLIQTQRWKPLDQHSIEAQANSGTTIRKLDGETWLLPASYGSTIHDKNISNIITGRLPVVRPGWSRMPALERKYSKRHGDRVN